MLAEIASAYTTAKNSFDLAKTVLQFTQDHKVREAVSDLLSNILELQRQLGEAQEKYTELFQQNADLQKQLREQANWKDETERYQLVTLGDQIFAYALREERSKGEPPHMLCHHCFHEKRKSILDRGSVNRSLLKCPACQFEVCLTRNEIRPPMPMPGRLNRHRNIDGL